MKQLKRFTHYYKPFIGLIIFDLLCAAVSAGCELAYPMIVRSITNDVLSDAVNKILYGVLLAGGLYLILRVIDALAHYLMTYIGHSMGVDLEANMRADLFEHLQRLPFSFYDNSKVGKIMSRVTNDLFEITEFAHHCPEEFFIAFIKLVGSFILLAGINTLLTVYIFALLPIMLVSVVFYRRKMRRAFRASKAQVAEINADLEDSLSGIRVVKSFANEDVEIEKFGRENDKFRVIRKCAYKFMAKFHGGIVLGEGIVYVAVVVLGAIFMMNNQITAGDLITYLLFIQSLLTTIRRIAEFTEQFEQGMTGILRFYEIMDEPVTIQNDENAVEIRDVSGSIDFNDVTFAYSEKGDVLKHFTLKISAGENIAIVGPSGGGKTTISNLIPRFYDVREGSISLDGTDIRKIKMQSLRENIGIVQQDVYLFAGTVLENISYGKMGASEEEIINAAKSAGAHGFITELPDGYRTQVGERGVKLSGGQKQRISIARLFLKNPPILILDEATSALDNENEKLVQESLEKLAKGRTTITIAHRLTTIRNADRIVVLFKDGIREEGTHDELIAKNGDYAFLYKQYR